LSENKLKFRRVIQTIIFLNKTRKSNNQLNINKIIAQEEEKANFYEIQMKLKMANKIANEIIESFWQK